jgi:hypothetical protein
MSEEEPLLGTPSEKRVADGLFGALLSKTDELDSSEEIVRRIAEMKEKAAQRRTEYEQKGLKTVQDRAAYKAGHRELYVRRENLLEVLMSSLRGKQALSVYNLSQSVML